MNIKNLNGLPQAKKEELKKGRTVSFEGWTMDLQDLERTVEEMDIRMIARSLSRESRYLGHTGGNPLSGTNAYSVAQHAVRGSEALLLIGRVKDAYTFLHHDDGEAIISEISAPLKNLAKQESKSLSEIEEKVDSLLAKRFGFAFPFPESIDIVDKNLAQEEMALLMQGGVGPKGRIEEQFEYWDEHKAFDKYLLQHTRITRMLELQKEGE